MAEKGYRSHGEGSITQRGSRTWRLRYDGPPNADGTRKQVSETFKGTKGDAIKLLQQRIRDVQAGEFVRPRSDTVASFLDSWLKDHAAHIAPKTLEGYAACVRNYIVPAIGNVRLQRLEPVHIQSLYTGMRERGLSDSTRALTHRTLRKALGDALRLNVIARNPALAVTPPRQARKRPEAWSVSDIKRFLEAAADSPFRNVFELALRTGLRRSELAALKWTDIDLERKFLTVSRSLQRLGGRGLVTGDTKSHRPRIIALSPRTVDLLKGVRREQTEWQLAAGPAWEDGGYVFTDRLGNPIDSTRFTKEFKAIIRKSGLPETLTLHSARHAFVSLLAAEGIHPRIISEMAGHASMAFTMDVYGHLLPSMQESAAAAIDAALTK